MIKRYRMQEGEIEVTLLVNTSKFTPEYASIINSIVAGKDKRLRTAHGDPVKAALIMSFPIIFKALADGHNSVGATGVLNEHGFFKEKGISISGYVMPDLTCPTVWEVDPL